MRNRYTIIQTLFVLLLCATFVPHAGARSAKLTENQLQHLVKIQAPDHLIASQINSRGLAFTLTYAIVKKLSSEGAGPQTLGALRGLVRVGAIMIHTQPASAVMIGDRYAGTTNSVGILIVQDIPVGPHNVTVSKEGFQGGHQNVIVANGQMQQTSIPMQWLGGDLSIEVNPSNASVSVTGPRSFSGAHKNVPCPQGTYTISVAAKGYLTQNRETEIASGTHTKVAIDLKPDPAYISTTIASARRFLAVGNVQKAADLARAVLALNSDNPFAESILVHAAYQEGDEQDFVRQALQIIQGGGKVTITMMHLRTFPRMRIRPVSLIFSAKGVAFSENAQKGKKDKVPSSLAYADVIASQVRRLQNGTLEIFLEWVAAHHSRFMAVGHNIELVTGDSELVAPAGSIEILGSGNETVRSPSDAWQQLSGINYLFQHLR